MCGAVFMRVGIFSSIRCALSVTSWCAQKGYPNRSKGLNDGDTDSDQFRTQMVTTSLMKIATKYLVGEIGLGS